MAHKYPRLPSLTNASAKTQHGDTQTRKPRTKKGTLPDFAPVPREYDRCDGWNPERQQGFIEALADLGSVKAAASHVGMSAVGAYLLRRHPAADGFRKAWEAALKLGVARLEDVAMDRALNGVEVPIYHFGAVVGTRRVHNDRLLMFILRNRARKRFAADSVASVGAAEQGELKRHKRKWRAEWEAELEAHTAQSSAATLSALDAKLERMRIAQLAAMSPETRALQQALSQSLARDRANAAGAEAGRVEGSPPALSYHDPDEDDLWGEDDCDEDDDT